MKKTFPVPALALVECQISETDTSATLILTNVNGSKVAYGIGPDGLNAILTPLLNCAVKWADEPNLKPMELVGPERVLPAQEIYFTGGLQENEFHLYVRMGGLDLVFAVSLGTVLRAIKEFNEQMDEAEIDGMPPPDSKMTM